MHYEINVSRNGKHFFATAPRSLTDKEQARDVYLALCERFNVADGYKVTVMKWETVGRDLPGLSLFDPD